MAAARNPCLVDQILFSHSQIFHSLYPYTVSKLYGRQYRSTNKLERYVAFPNLGNYSFDIVGPFYEHTIHPHTSQQAGLSPIVGLPGECSSTYLGYCFVL